MSASVVLEKSVSQHWAWGLGRAPPASRSRSAFCSGGDRPTDGMWVGETVPRVFSTSAFLEKVKIRKSGSISCHSVAVGVCLFAQGFFWSQRSWFLVECEVKS